MVLRVASMDGTWMAMYDTHGYFDTGCMVLRVASMDGTWMAMHYIHGYFDTGCMVLSGIHGQYVDGRGMIYMRWSL